MKERFKKIVSNFIFKQPFFGYAGLHLNFREDRRIPEVGVDEDGNFYYNPDYLSKVSDLELEVMIAHAILHLVLQHFPRRKNRDKFLWDIATDIEVNYTLYNYIYSGFLPEGFLVYYSWAYSSMGRVRTIFGHPDYLKEISAERIYEVLRSMGKIKIRESPEGRRFRVLEMEEAYKNEKGKSGEGFLKRLKEKFFKESNKMEERAGHDLHIEGAEKWAEEKEKWKRIGVEAYHFAKSIGKMPKMLEETVKVLIFPKMPWNVILRRYISDIARDVYNWYPPARRYIHQGLYLPSLYSPLLKIAIAIDTSGSISNKEAEAFVSEVNAIISSFPSYSILLIQCDAKIHSEMEITTGDFLPSSFKILGRGGTDFRPVFERLKDETEIKALIYLTDGLGEYPKKEPPYPVLWVFSKSPEVHPPFGISILMDIDED
jgi:predicted metal-dependent peptidase